VTAQGTNEGRVRAGLTKRLRSRQALLEAAEAVFSEHGWNDTRLEDVARRAGVSVATAYNHFPGKYVLIGHVYSSHIAPVLQQAVNDEAAQRPAAQALADHLHQLATVFRTNRSLTAAFANAVQEFTARVQQRPDPDDENDPRVLVPVPHGLGVLIDAARARTPDRTRDPARASVNFRGAGVRPSPGCRRASSLSPARNRCLMATYGSTRAAPCCGVVGMCARPIRLRNTQ
jgi:AcrR family transcriptional regulator